MSPRIIAWVLAGITAGLAAAPATADDEDPDWYTVEVIVFLHRADAADAGERWPTDPGAPAVDDAAALHPPTIPAALTPYERLTPDALRLGGTFATLERSSRYRALLHTGWMQAGLPPDRSTAVRIDEFSGERLDTVPLEIELPYEPVDEPGTPEASMFEFDFDLIPDPDTAPGPESFDHAGTDTPEPPRMISGTIMLNRQRFLHVEVDLLYTSGEPLAERTDDADTRSRRYRLDEDIEWLTAGTALAPRFQAYRLRDNRQVDTGELHYFDHPVFGVIVAVNPVPEEEVEARRDAYEAAYREALLRREAERL